MMHPHKVPMEAQRSLCTCGSLSNELHLTLMDAPFLDDPAEQQKVFAGASTDFTSHQDDKHRLTFRKSLQQWYNIPGEETTSASPVATKMGPILAKKGIPGYDQFIAPPRPSPSNKSASSGPNSTTSNDPSPRSKSRTQSAPSPGKPQSSTLRQSRYASKSKAKPPSCKPPSRPFSSRSKAPNNEELS